MKIIQRINPNNILVRFETGLYENRVQTQLSFEDNYADALHTALEAVQKGYTNVSVVQYRQELHSHAELLGALRRPKNTDGSNWVPLPSYLNHVVALWGCAA